MTYIHYFTLMSLDQILRRHSIKIIWAFPQNTVPRSAWKASKNFTFTILNARNKGEGAPFPSWKGSWAKNAATLAKLKHDDRRAPLTHVPADFRTSLAPTSPPPSLPPCPSLSRGLAQESPARPSPKTTESCRTAAPQARPAPRRPPTLTGSSEEAAAAANWGGGVRRAGGPGARPPPRPLCLSGSGCPRRAPRRRRPGPTRVRPGAHTPGIVLRTARVQASRGRGVPDPRATTTGWRLRLCASWASGRAPLPRRPPAAAHSGSARGPRRPGPPHSHPPAGHEPPGALPQLRTTHPAGAGVQEPGSRATPARWGRAQASERGEPGALDQPPRAGSGSKAEVALPPPRGPPLFLQ